MKKAIKFFDEKRTWSKMKDRIIGWYLIPYITKVKQFNKKIVIVDGFAGTGFYKDGTEGSPIIICKILEERANSIGAEAVGIFIEKDPKCFKELEKNLKIYEDKKLAVTLHGDFKELALKIIELASQSPTFFYIDPFGIKGLEYEHLKKIFEKVKISSTEVLVRFDCGALLRIASAGYELADKVMGGNYYRKILEGRSLEKAEKEEKIVHLYKSLYSEYFEYVGFCPVMYKEQTAKYYLIFATSKFDGIKLMNNQMGDVYREFHTEGRLFPSLPDDMTRDLEFLESQVLEVLRTYGIINRLSIMQELIQKFFMRYRESDYNSVISNLLKKSQIYSKTGKKRIKDSIPLSLTSFGR